MSWNTWSVLEGWSINREMMCTDVYCTHYIYRLYSLHDVIYIYTWYRYKTWSALFIWGIDASTERLWTCKQWERWHSSTPKGPRQLHVMLRDGHQSMNGEYTVYKYIYIGILMRDGWPYNIYHVLTMSQMNALVQRRPKKFCSTPMCLWQDVTPFCGLATIFVPDITWVRIFISQATFLCFSAFGWWVSWLEWSGSSRQKESLQHVGDFRDWNQLVMCCKISMYAYSWICTLFIIYFFFWKCSDSCSLWSFPDSCVSNTPKPVSSGFRQCTVGFKWPAL